jgi:hypothetical protein
MFANRVQRRIFGLKKDDMTGEWRKLHSEELRDLYSVLDPLLLRKSCSTGNRTRELWVCNQELRPLDQRGGPNYDYSSQV